MIRSLHELLKERKERTLEQIAKETCEEDS